MNQPDQPQTTSQTNQNAAERSEAATPSPDPIQRHPLLRTKAHYAEAIKEFDWSYLVEALPVPSTRSTKSKISYGKSEPAIINMLESVFARLTKAQRKPIFYSFCLETGAEGWLHPHVHLGAISRLNAQQVGKIFQNNKFGQVKVRRWNRNKEKGYSFKSLDAADRQHYNPNAYWGHEFSWTRKCKQKMKLCRKHLNALEGPHEWSTPKPAQPQTDPNPETTPLPPKRTFPYSIKRLPFVRRPAAATAA